MSNAGPADVFRPGWRRRTLEAMARAYWKGSISFGLVNVPVALYPAVRRKDIRFHLYHDADGGRIREKRVCTLDDREVPWEHVVKGYEVSKGQVVTLTQEELQAADPARERSIVIEEFVPLAQVEVMLHDQSYWIAPEARSGKAYALLVQALARNDDVAVARIVLSTQEHLCLVRSASGRLVLTTLVWADELQAAPEVSRATTTPKELQMAEQLIRSMSGKFDARAFKDQHRSRVEALLRKKAQGKPIEVAAPSKPAQVIDLARALEQSLASAGRGRMRPGRRPARARRRAPRATARRSVRSR
jgi:DNA end-binding protein Ku